MFFVIKFFFIFQKVDDIRSALHELEIILSFPLKGKQPELWKDKRFWSESHESTINCFFFLYFFYSGFVAGTTAVRKSHQIPVESLVSYLNNELGLKQEGDLKHWKKKDLF